MVEYCDGSIIAQMGKPDMRVPISYALSFPKRCESGSESIDFFGGASDLSFEKPDEDTCICLKLARQALKHEGSSYPVVLNAANEILVQLFLEKKINFLDIQNNIEKALTAHKPEYGLGVNQILELDMKIRDEVKKCL
jgi:1-deoxy-D-xylulose-5-phosphate reductoisomerase